jgi:hypothetical protein
MTAPKYINFHNNTDLSVDIESWVDGSNQMKRINVKPGEKLVIHSSVGEWHLTNVDREILPYYYIGKFWSVSCASGNYSWMDYYDFDCVYSKAANETNGLITFSKSVYQV